MAKVIYVYPTGDEQVKPFKTIWNYPNVGKIVEGAYVVVGVDHQPFEGKIYIILEWK